MLFIQIIATEALYTVCKTKEKIFAGFQPLPPDSERGGKEEDGRVHPLGRKAVLPQPNALQEIYSLGSQGQAEVTGTKEFQQMLANKRFCHIN